MTTATTSDHTASVTPITAAPSYSINLANQARWCDFTVPCYDVDSARALAEELKRVGVSTFRSASAVTARYDAAAPIVTDMATNIAMVAISGDFADADELMMLLAVHEEAPATAEVVVLPR